jgi:hypothetical protein
MTNSMKGMSIRCTGIELAKFAIGIMKLVFNMNPYRYLVAAHA